MTSDGEKKQDSDARIRSIFQGAPIGMGVINNRILVEVNDLACEITGYSRDELIGKKTKMLYLTDEDYESVGRDKERLIAKGKPGSVETRMKRKDGRIINVLVSSTPLDRTDPSAGATFTVMDITVSKQIESALQRSIAQYGALFNQMTEGLVIFDPKGNLVNMNPAALAIHGFEKADSLKLSLDTLAADVFELFDLEENLLPPEAWPIGKVLRGETIYNFEVRVRRRDTGKTWIGSYGGTPVKGPDGQTLIHIVTLRDITAWKKTERALQALNETLEQKVAERTQLAEIRSKQLQSLAVELVEAEEFERQRIADLLHDDLQQLIASARMQIQLASEKDDPGPMLKNVEQLLEVSLEKSRRLSHELSPPVLHQFGLVAALEWLVRHMDEQFDLKVHLKTELANQVEETPLKIFLFRAVQELLFNCVKYSGVKNADVYLYDTDNRIMLYVSDKGQGFNPDILDFFKKQAGLGLLSLRERSHAIGGNLDIVSAPGRGSRFTLTVPISLGIKEEPRESNHVTISPSEILKKPIMVSDSEIIRVMFVDDHKVMRQGLIGIIADQPGIQPAGEAANGEEAIELARHIRPDVIIMDISMPGMGGVEATRRIKAEMPDIRVIGLSMFTDADIAHKMRQAGADGFVSKSESSSQLLKAIYKVAGPNRTPSH